MPVTDAIPAHHAGVVTAIRGSVVDVRFDGSPPGMRELLVAEGGLRLEVAAHVDSHTARCLAFGVTDGLARGAEVRPTGGTLSVTVGDGLLGRVIDVFGAPIDGG